MSVNVDLFGNQITPSEASPKKDAKPISTPPPTFDTSPTPDRVVSVETLGITPNYIATYETYLAGPNTNSIATADFNFQDRHHDCKMSQSAIKTIKKATSLICYLSKKQYFAQLRDEKLRAKNVGCTTKRYAEISQDAAAETRTKHLCTFLTLTLPAEQRHTDTELTKHLINPLLTYARKYWRVKYYIWKKELQANGNLHFHLIFDVTVPWQSLRKEWNHLCNQGKVKGVKERFDYVDRYHAKWSNIHANGFNREYVTEYVSNLPTTDLEFNEKLDAWQEQEGRELSTPEYNDLRRLTIEGIVSRYYKAYLKERDRNLKDPTYEMFTDPNSTDIRGVNSPQMVAAYMSKYIAKDIENNPALSNYQDKVDQYKREMDEWRKVAEYNRKNDIDDADAMECWQRNKEALDQYRANNCPIQGRMWFKSQSLTVFMSGARADFDDDYYAELTDLETYLHTEEDRINANRAKKAAHFQAIGNLEMFNKYKDPIHLVLLRYDTHPDGSINPEKVICKTLLISMFDLQHLKREDGKTRFPYLALLWNRYIKAGLYHNSKENLVEKTKHHAK